MSGTAPSQSPLGAPLPRLEDARLLRGAGSFVDDLHPPSLLHAAVLRSPHAHARITRLDVSAAREARGVHLVLTAADLGTLAAPLPMVLPHPAITAPRTHVALAAGLVRYVGEPIAFVVAESRYLAEDACDLVDVDYEPLDAVADLQNAVEPGAPLVHPDLGTNVAATVRMQVGDPDRAFAEAEHVFAERFEIDRGASAPMETRGVLAVWDELTGLSMWVSTQGPVSLRNGLARLFDLPLARIRVVAPDVGGGFGPKMMIYYPEEILVPLAAMRLKRPVKWIEDRLEHMVATNHERDQVHEAEIAVREDGRILGLRDRFLYDTGAYIPYGLNVPNVTAVTLPGPYRVPNYAVEYSAVYTHRTMVSPYRGAGRPQAVFVTERLLDRVARELGLDRAEVRRRNLIGPSELPYDVGLLYQDGAPLRYDSGDFPELLRRALGALDWDRRVKEREADRAHGRLLGLGLACYVEGTGYRSYEGARVVVEPTGRIVVLTGSGSQGQGHATALAQVVAAELSVQPNEVSVIAGDTAQFGWGLGTWASRTAVVAASAAQGAARAVRHKALEQAAARLEVAPGDLELRDGAVQVRGLAQRRLTLADLAGSVGLSRTGLASEGAPGLDATQFFSPEQATFASGVHAVVVEVDTLTCLVRILDYVVAHDCGRVINPLIVDGQVHGGVAQGIGGSLYEKLQYGPDGQLLTRSFLDYLLPTAGDVPEIHLEHLETPSPTNPLGVKGVGEAGAIPVPAVIASAVEDALAPFGARVTRMPLGPDDLAALMSGARP